MRGLCLCLLTSQAAAFVQPFHARRLVTARRPSPPATAAAAAAASSSSSSDDSDSALEGFLRPSTFNKEGNAADITISDALLDDYDEEDEDEEDEEEKATVRYDRLEVSNDTAVGAHETQRRIQQQLLDEATGGVGGEGSAVVAGADAAGAGTAGAAGDANQKRTQKQPAGIDGRSYEGPAVDFFGQSKRGDLLMGAGVEPLDVESDEDVERLLAAEGLPAALRTPYPYADPTRGVFCTRTLNMRNIQVIGYDMDYTLVRYRVSVWEERAYHYAKEWLRKKGFWVSGLKFVNDLVVRGLVVDREEGNILKVDRFGYVRAAMHGTRRLSMNQIQTLYGRYVVDLRESRWSFLNTLFSVSEATLYLQLVDRLDDGSLLAKGTAPFAPEKCDTYSKLFSAASKSVFRAHVTSSLKSEVLRDPAKFVELDEGLVRTLLDQRLAGKKLALITNSDWHYTNTIMSYIVGQSAGASSSSSGSSSIGGGGGGSGGAEGGGVVAGRKWKEAPAVREWRSLFDVVVVSARKPDFFTGKMPVYEIVTEPEVPGILSEGDAFGTLAAAAAAADSTGDLHLHHNQSKETRGEEGGLLAPVERQSGDALMQEVFKLSEGRIYNGGTARLIEKLFRVSRERILYVGDHVFSDVSIAKATNRWRTLLVLQELEGEVAGVAGSHETRRELKVLLSRKDRLADVLNHLRTVLRRIETRGPPESLSPEEATQRSHHHDLMQRILAKLMDLDVQIETRLTNYGATVNRNWGFMSRAGFSDKSHIMRQMEKYADVYTSRVSNLLRYTPYAYFRAGQQSLAHDGDDLAGFLSEQAADE